MRGVDRRVKTADIPLLIRVENPLRAEQQARLAAAREAQPRS